MLLQICELLRQLHTKGPEQGPPLSQRREAREYLLLPHPRRGECARQQCHIEEDAPEVASLKVQDPLQPLGLLGLVIGVSGIH